MIRPFKVKWTLNISHYSQVVVTHENIVIMYKESNLLQSSTYLSYISCNRLCYKIITQCSIEQ